MKKLFLFSILFSILQFFNPSILNAQGFLDRVDLGIDKIKYSKLDTNYIAPPAYKLMVSVESKNYWGRDNIHIPFTWNDPDIYNEVPGLEKYETDKILSHSNQSSINFRVSYKGFAASYGFALNGSGSKKSFALGSNGNKFGFKLGFERNNLSNARFRDYRYLPLMYLFINGLYEEGALDNPVTIDEIAQHSVFEKDDYISEDDEERIGENDAWELEEVAHWYANFYYAFNHRKFSMSAANYAQYIQKRSAGSFFVTGDVNYTRVKAHDMFFYVTEPLEISDSLSSREKFSSFGFALGAGYGYNWTPNHGKFLLHASLRPTVNVYNHMRYSGKGWAKNEDTGETIWTKGERIPELEPLYDHKMKLTFGGVGRVAAVWNITPKIVAGANMEYTIRDNRNSKDYRMYNSRLNFNAYFAMRFIKNKKH
ncbi:MAG: DUF4421 family protein [Bacteroidaceae bacterium]|nr:DUF4421 family protein [Bacteroidaceae bacterium]